MKSVILLLFVIIAVNVSAQSVGLEKKETGVAVGVSGGYSSLKSVVGNYTMGAMLSGMNHVSVNLQLFGQFKNANVPVIGEARIGHVFNTVELYAGYGYHYASSDGNKFIKEQVNGFKPAFGVIKYFYNSPLTISAGMSSNIFSVQLGIFGVR